MPSRHATLPLLALLTSLSLTSATPSPSVTITTAPNPTDGFLNKRGSQGPVDTDMSSYETTSPLPLTEYFYPYSAVPYQVNPYAIARGPQSGYNQCNSTTEGPNAQCQTAVVNSLDDFCLWGAPGTSGGEEIGNVEAAVVAYCTKSGHGARIFPPGAIMSAQFMKTPGYIQVVGYLNQSTVNLDPTDYGGELDPHGADFLGNPLGGLVYSTGMPLGDNSTYRQTQSWNNFIGSGQFCFKLCDPSYDTDLNFCQNIYDLIGCTYNMPANYAALTPGTFLSCEGDLQDEVGTYTSAGATYTWSQPSSLPASSTLPWTPRVPASSNCVTMQSSDLYPLASLGYQSNAAVASSSATTTGSGSTSAATGSMSGSGSSSMRSGSSSSSARTTSGSASGSAATSSSAALSAYAHNEGLGSLLATSFTAFAFVAGVGAFML